MAQIIMMLLLEVIISMKISMIASLVSSKKEGLVYGQQDKKVDKHYTSFKKEKKKLTELRYVFCSDQYLLEINQQFLQHDFYTDIITFPLSDPGQPISGEIYISVDRVRENAATATRARR